MGTADERRSTPIQSYTPTQIMHAYPIIHAYSIMHAYPIIHAYSIMHAYSITRLLDRAGGDRRLEREKEHMTTPWSREDKMRNASGP
jgi:hypothetical protein